MTIEWKIEYSKSAFKQAKKLNKNILYAFRVLTKELSKFGPVALHWPNYGRLQGGKKIKHHCHFKKGRPTYVCCWKVIDKEHKIIEVYYVGTHEKAPY